MVLRALFLLSVSLALPTDNCPSTLSWVSNASTFVYSERFRPSIIVSTQSGWKQIEGASRIWESSTYTTGTFTFLRVFPLVDRLQASIEKVSVLVTCDDYYGISVNGQVVVGKAGAWDDSGTEYDLTPYVKYSTEASPTANRLEITCTNTKGPGGLAYRVDVAFKAGRTLQIANVTEFF